jgi:hypothetical protein
MSAILLTLIFKLMKGNVFKGQECGWYKKVVLVLQKPFHT